MRKLVLVTAVLMFVATAAQGQIVIDSQPAVDFSLGYSHLFIDTPPSERITKDGAYIDLGVSAKVLNAGVPLLLGGGISATGYFRTDHVDVEDSSGFIFREHLDSDFGIYTLEARAAIPLQFGRDQGFFLCPRLGAGLVVNSYGIDHAEDTANGTFFSTDWHTGAAFGIHPSIEAGYFSRQWSVGAQVSYLVAWGDFGVLESTAQEIRAGVFLRFTPWG